MKTSFRLCFLVFMVSLVTGCWRIESQPGTPSSAPSEPEILGIFAGNTPCTAPARPLLQIPADADCDQLIWRLALYRDPQTGGPTTYRLDASFGLSKQGTNDLIDGGTSITREGGWTITKGAQSDPGAVVYQMNPDDPETTLSFLRINDNLIHVLDEDNAMLVGNGAWSYTLDRMGHESLAEAHEQPWWLPNPPTRPPAPPRPDGSSVFGVFDGRTPCNEVALAFTGTAARGCLKIKWRLTLYQDDATGEPSRYLYMGTSAYREGTWNIVRGTEGDPDVVLYQLHPDGEGQVFHFLKVDDNHLFLMDEAMNLLVGNEFFSYTLSRTDRGS